MSLPPHDAAVRVSVHQSADNIKDDYPFSLKAYLKPIMMPLSSSPPLSVHYGEDACGEILLGIVVRQAVVGVVCVEAQVLVMAFMS